MMCGDIKGVFDVKQEKGYFPGALLRFQGRKAREMNGGALGRNGWTGIISG